MYLFMKDNTLAPVILSGQKQLTSKLRVIRVSYMRNTESNITVGVNRNREEGDSRTYLLQL